MTGITTIILTCLFLVSGASLQAGILMEGLVDQCRSGNPRSIAAYCARNIDKAVGLERFDEEYITRLTNDWEMARLCYAASFFSQIGNKSQYTVKSLKDREFTEFLLKDPHILKDLAFSRQGSHLTLDALYQIWLRENKALEGTSLCMALGAALSLSSDEQIEDRLARYAFYRQSLEEGKLFDQFDELQPWEMAILFGSGRNLEELSWAQDYTAAKKKFTARSAGGAACRFIPYRMKNKDGISIHKGAAFYDHKPQTLPILVEYGGVCGAVSTGACGFVAARGIPGYTVGQPGHCAFLWKTLDGRWTIGNDIYGWVWTAGKNRSPWPGHPYMMAAAAKFQTGDSKADHSWLCYELSTMIRDEIGTRALLERAVNDSTWNIPAWKALLRLKAKGLKDNDKETLVRGVAAMFRNEPLVVKELVEDGIGIRADKGNALRLAALMLGSSDSREASDMYMMALSKQADSTLSAWKGKPAFNAKNRAVYFKQWEDACKDGKFTGMAKKQACDLLERALADLHNNPAMTKKLLTTYVRQIRLWEQPKYHQRSLAFLKQQLQTMDGGSPVGSLLADAGLQLAKQADSEQDINYFTQAAQSHPAIRPDKDAR